MWEDSVNAFIELLGGFVLLLNVKRILKDKLVRGMDWRVMAFFTLWGLWNLYYYPQLDQWWSAAAAGWTAAINMIYLSLMIYYIRREKHGSD